MVDEDDARLPRGARLLAGLARSQPSPPGARPPAPAACPQYRFREESGSDEQARRHQHDLQPRWHAGGGRRARRPWHGSMPADGSVPADGTVPAGRRRRVHAAARG